LSELKKQKGSFYETPCRFGCHCVVAVVANVLLIHFYMSGMDLGQSLGW